MWKHEKETFKDSQKFSDTICQQNGTQDNLS